MGASVCGGAAKNNIGHLAFCRFHTDPSGTYLRYDAKAIGSGSEGAQSTLQEEYHSASNFVCGSWQHILAAASACLSCLACARVIKCAREARSVGRWPHVRRHARARTRNKKPRPGQVQPARCPAPSLTPGRAWWRARLPASTVAHPGRSHETLPEDFEAGDGGEAEFYKRRGAWFVRAIERLLGRAVPVVRVRACACACACDAFARRC